MVDVTVAIPVRDGGQLLADTLRALSVQTVEHELLVCDSGSLDGSAGLARSHGARVIEIPAARFSHGGTRNLLMQEACGARVALLTQDAQPASEDWLKRLLEGFELADDVAIVYGPYRPRAEASLGVQIELERWFDSLAPDGTPQVERLVGQERTLPAERLVGRRGFFTDANACIDRRAWERVPFRRIAYAEDRALALDMLRAGYAKAFVPAAAVLHSHEYSLPDRLRRSFDEWRGLHEVYGWRAPASPRQLAMGARGELGSARRALAARGVAGWGRRRALVGIAAQHAAGTAGALLGSRSDRLPASVCGLVSLERRGEPVERAPTRLQRR